MKTIVLAIICLWTAAFFTGCSDRMFPNDYEVQGNDETMPTGDNFNGVCPDGFVMTNVDKTQRLAKTTAYPTSKLLNVPYRQQETNYWCGPASAQMVNYYYNMPVSQKRIADFCGTNPGNGTYVYKLTAWLNDPPMTGGKVLPSWWKWESYCLKNLTDFNDKIRYSFATHSAPQIWHLRTHPSSIYYLPGWTANNGHYVCGSGYAGNNVQYEDPWYGSGGGADIAVAASTMYQCIKANAGYIIY